MKIVISDSNGIREIELEKFAGVSIIPESREEFDALTESFVEYRPKTYIVGCSLMDNTDDVYLAMIAHERHIRRNNMAKMNEAEWREEPSFRLNSEVEFK